MRNQEEGSISRCDMWEEKGPNRRDCGFLVPQTMPHLVEGGSPPCICALEARSQQWESFTNIALYLISVDKASDCPGSYHFS